MYVALHLVHLLQQETPVGRQAKLVAIAKTREDLIGWYEQFIVDPYIGMAPDMESGTNKEYTKHFAEGSPLEWFEPLPDYEVNNNRPSGIFNVPTFEEFSSQMDEHFNSELANLRIRTQAQIDHYRNTIEPKMVKYVATAKRTVQ